MEILHTNTSTENLHVEISPKNTTLEIFYIFMENCTMFLTCTKDCLKANGVHYLIASLNFTNSHVVRKEAWPPQREATSTRVQNWWQEVQSTFTQSQPVKNVKNTKSCWDFFMFIQYLHIDFPRVRIDGVDDLTGASIYSFIQGKCDHSLAGGKSHFTWPGLEVYFHDWRSANIVN